MHLLFPPLCIHCASRLFGQEALFCPMCLEHLPLIEFENRCRTCCLELKPGGCERCKQRPVIIRKQIAALERIGPARSLLNQVEKGNQRAIKAAASLMVYQWVKKQSISPESIIVVPWGFFKTFRSENNPPLQLAKEVATLMGIPFFSSLKAHYDHFHFLSHDKMQLKFSLKKRQQEGLINKRLLLVSCHLNDDLLRKAAETLQQAYPASVEALSLTL